MPAAYFSNFPQMGYSLNSRPQPGEFEWVTDIFRRSAPVAAILQNKLLFYTYQVADGDTPEIIAHKYYGSVKYHWIVSIMNNMMDPLAEWPKNYMNLRTYIVDKYGSVPIAKSTIHHYTMTLTRADSLGHTSAQTFFIDQTKYNSLTGMVPQVFTFADGNTVTVTTTRAAVDCYDYEDALNESKRTIVLLKDEYVPQIVRNLELLNV